MTTDAKGLERKFTDKNLKRSTPGVVLFGSMAQLTELANMSLEVTAFTKTIGIRTFCSAAFCRGKTTD